MPKQEGILYIPLIHQTEECVFFGTTKRTMLSLPHLIIAQLPYPSGLYLWGDGCWRVQWDIAWSIAERHLKSSLNNTSTNRPAIVKQSQAANTTSAFPFRPPHRVCVSCFCDNGCAVNPDRLTKGWNQRRRGGKKKKKAIDVTATMLELGPGWDRKDGEHRQSTTVCESCQLGFDEFVFVLLSRSKLCGIYRIKWAQSELISTAAEQLCHISRCPVLMEYFSHPLLHFFFFAFFKQINTPIV